MYRYMYIPAQCVERLCTCIITYMYMYVNCTICEAVVYMYMCRCTCTLPVQFVKRLYACISTLNTYVELIEECCVHVPSVPSTECVSADSDNEEPYQLQQVGTTPHVTHVKHPCTIQVQHTSLQHTDHNLVAIYLIDKLR